MTDMNTDNQATTPLVDLLGPTLISSDLDGEDVEISVAELAKTKKVIVLYFSAHWCPPCRGFTPKLSQAYAEYMKSTTRSEDDGFELVFVSSDKDAESFKKYHGEMSFSALPYEARDIKAKLSEKFSVRGIPHLVAIDASTGDEASAVTSAVGGDLRSFIVQHGAAAFPLSPSHLLAMKAEAEEKQSKALGKLVSSPIVVSVPQEESTSTIGFGELFEQYEYVGLVFGDGDGADDSYTKIQEAAKALNNEDKSKFIPVYVGWTAYGESSNHSALWERFYSIREDVLTDEVRSILGDVAGESVDCLTMITIQSKTIGLCGLDGNCESGGPVVVTVDKGVRALGRFGPNAFPWDETAVKKAMKVKENRICSLKEKLTGFNFLSGDDGKSLLVSGDESVAIEDLLASGKEEEEDNSAVLGLYFSAHWCPPCRAFTPELLKVYDSIQAEKGQGSFEVVFVSFDRDESAYKEYYSTQQWLSLDYNKSRELCEDLMQVFGVRGFPSLVLLKKDGTIVSSNARSSVSQYGADCFPWDAESIQVCEEKALEKEEENVATQRELGGGVVVRRVLGPVGSVTYDATDRVLGLSSPGFITAILDETLAMDGVLYYETEVLNKTHDRPIAQLGFALKNGLPKQDKATGMGVGDNDKSWGICGFRKQLWHNGSSTDGEVCGWEVGDVIGFAVNIDNGKIAISKNAEWSKEAGCGVVFKNVSLAKADGDGCGGIHPGLSLSGLQVRLNVNEEHLRFTKPSEEVWQS